MDAREGKTIIFQEKAAAGFLDISRYLFEHAINGGTVKDNEGHTQMLGLLSDDYYTEWKESEVRNGKEKYAKGWSTQAPKKLIEMTTSELIEFLRQIVATLKANNPYVETFDVLLPLNVYSEIMSKKVNGDLVSTQYIATKVPEIRSFRSLPFMKDAMVFYQNDRNRLTARILIAYSPITEPKEDLGGVVRQVYRMRFAGVHANGCSSFAKIGGITQ